MNGWIYVEYHQRQKVYNPEFRGVVAAFHDVVSFDLSPEENYKLYGSQWIETAEYLWTLEMLEGKLKNYCGKFPQIRDGENYRWDLGGAEVYASRNGDIIFDYSGDPLSILATAGKIA